MQSFEKLILLAELDGETCGLSHGPKTEGELFPAINYLVVPMGCVKKDGTEMMTQEMVIPVCMECMEGVTGDTWTLLYCLECNESRWVHRDLAKNRYRHHVLWLKGCPECSNQFGGLYFNDMPNATQHGLHLPTLAA